MNNKENELSSNDATILKRIFQKIGDDIKDEFDKKIVQYSNSLLFKYYSNLYYFLPKSCLLEIKDKDHNGYYIRPQEYFFIEDKRTNKTLTYTTKSESIIVPIKEIKTVKNSDTSINISLNFENNFEYDYLTIWLNPKLCDEDPFFAAYIFKQIIESPNSARVKFSNYTYTTKDIEVEPVNLQLKPTENLVLNLHSPSLLYGVNIKIKDLFKYRSSNLEKLDFFFEIKTDNYDEESLSSLFRVNLVPIFNSFNDYSHATFAMLNLSNSKLKHYEKDDAQAVEIISIYENNKPCQFNGFFFKGQNEYYFNRNSQSLNYNVVFPKLNNKVSETKIHTYSTWTQVTDISDLIEINSNVITSISCNISPTIINKSINNYNRNTDAMLFNIVDMIISKNIYSKTTFLAIIKLLKVDNDDISLLSSLLKNIELNEFTNELIVTTSDKYNKKHKYFLEFFLEIICKFINQNTFSFIRKIILNSR